MPDISAAALRGRIKFNREAWNQHQFDEQYDYAPVKSTSLLTRLKKQCRFRDEWLLRNLKSCVPILGWLPNYERSFVLSDMIAGFTVGIMLVPQGMAYASLAGLEPVYGLYSSFFPSLLYMIFGTSRHISLGK
uniref:SLC26A/SulP transporter domain-containing protein n=1 Tax=Plectus sambesii TaxID=2011161 RepID=A0A914XUH4_9BILA